MKTVGSSAGPSQLELHAELGVVDVGVGAGFGVGEVGVEVLAELPPPQPDAKTVNTNANKTKLAMPALESRRSRTNLHLVTAQSMDLNFDVDHRNWHMSL